MTEIQVFIRCHFSDRSLSDPFHITSGAQTTFDGATSQTARSAIRCLLRAVKLGLLDKCHFSDRSLSDPFHGYAKCISEFNECHFSDRSLSDPL